MTSKNAAVGSGDQPVAREGVGFRFRLARIAQPGQLGDPGRHCPVGAGEQQREPEFADQRLHHVALASVAQFVGNHPGDRIRIVQLVEQTGEQHDPVPRQCHRIDHRHFDHLRPDRRLPGPIDRAHQPGQRGIAGRGVASTIRQIADQRGTDALLDGARHQRGQPARRGCDDQRQHRAHHRETQRRAP